MKLSTRSRYGVRMMLDMSMHCDAGPLRLGEIAKRQGIPVKYLEQIIIPLKKAAYVKSVRGPKGGHLLSRKPEEITVGEIVDLLEGELKLTKCSKTPEICERSDFCAVRYIWKELTEAMQERLHAITFADLLKRSRAIARCSGE